MIQVSEKAAEHIKKLLVNEKGAEGLRVSVVGGGCSGLSYKLSFDQASKPGDQVFEEHGVKLFVDMKSYLYVNGTVLNYSDGLNGQGFTFENPNAKKSCGCGSSFAV
jgi:iron-sulfur cluster assembly protein